MTTKELMVGDWVLMDMNYLEEDPMYTKTDYKPHKIQNGEDIDLACETNCIGDGDVYRPIPLTPEILEKNGFRRAKEQETALSTVYMSPYPVRVCEAAKVKVVFYDLPICGVNVLVQIEADTKSGGGVNSLHSCDIEYVHQLQNALRLCGIEKEIEL